jgi:hypothetical protein
MCRFSSFLESRGQPLLDLSLCLQRKLHDLH